mmetsp:Transcript_16573/g.24184  ORF Transcript_16573/g.24184 Transcript_16573/m.24184 type:complete len:257 (+) Transcript_16573:471-1241(+)
MMMMMMPESICIANDNLAGNFITYLLISKYAILDFNFSRYNKLFNTRKFCTFSIMSQLFIVVERWTRVCFIFAKVVPWHSCRSHVLHMPSVPIRATLLRVVVYGPLLLFRRPCHFVNTARSGSSNLLHCASSARLHQPDATRCMSHNNQNTIIVFVTRIGGTNALHGLITPIEELLTILRQIGHKERRIVTFQSRKVALSLLYIRQGFVKVTIPNIQFKNSIFGLDLDSIRRITLDILHLRKHLIGRLDRPQKWTR